MSATCGLDFERQLTSPAFEVRGVISEALRELGFQIVVDQMTRIEAKRGSMLGYSLMMKARMPVLAVFEISLAPPGCVVAIHLTDNVKNVGKAWGVNRHFHELFDEVQQRVDAGLASLEPGAAAGFSASRFWSRSGDVGILEQGTQLTSRAVGTAIGTATKALDRPKDHTPGMWKGVDSVTFCSVAGEAILGLPEAQALLGVAVMIASHPGSMPPNLLRDVEAFAAIVEQQLTAAGGSAARVDVTDPHKPVFEFLNAQAQIRSALPMRQLYTCRTCHLEKIVNPDYKRIVNRNEKIGDIMAGVGATITKGGISPTFVLGQVFKLKRLDPEYVCSRCQGMEADERVVTFCPTCGDLQRDVVLRLCAKCKFDFRTKSAKGPVWTEPRLPEPEPEPEPVSVGGLVSGGVDGMEAEPPSTESEADAAAYEAVFESEVAAIPSEQPIDQGDLPEAASEAAPEDAATEPDATGPEISTGPAAAPAPPAAAAAPAAPASAAPTPKSAPAPAAPTPAPAAPAPAPAPKPAPTPTPTPKSAPAPAPTPASAPKPAPAPATRAPAPVAPAPAAPAPVAPAPAAPAAWPPPPPQSSPPQAQPAPAAWSHPLSVPVGRPAVGPYGGKVCSICRQEHSVLWRVVVATQFGYEERFLCGSTPACQMPSLVVATQV